MKIHNGWDKLNINKYHENEVVCDSCKNSNCFGLNKAFGFYKNNKDKNYFEGTILCFSCIKAEGLSADV